MFFCAYGTQCSHLPFEERNAIIIRYVIYIRQLGRQTLTGRWLLLLRQSFNFLATFVLNVDKIFWGKKKNTHKHISFPHLWSISSHPQTKEKSILTVFFNILKSSHSFLNFSSSTVLSRHFCSFNSYALNIIYYLMGILLLIYCCVTKEP